jgi:DNA polymerase III delta subunit
VPAVVVLAGAERWFREEGLKRIVDAVLPDGDPGGCFRRLDARLAEDREAVAAAIDELHTGSLFGTGKVVAIEHPEAAAGPWLRDKRQSPITALAVAAAEAPVANTVLVLSTSRPVKGQGAVSTAVLTKAGALVVDCRALYDAPGPWERGAAPYDHELARFLASRMRHRHGKRLDVQDAHVLTRLVGADLGDLDDALASLALYAEARERITSADLDAVHGRRRTDPAWRLTDAVFDRDLSTALDLVEAAFQRGIPDARGGVVVRPEGVFAMLFAALHGTYRRVLAGAEALARGGTPADVAKAAGVPAFRANAFLERCRRDPAALLARNTAFLDAETGVRGGGRPHRAALERLVLALTEA